MSDHPAAPNSNSNLAVTPETLRTLLDVHNNSVETSADILLEEKSTLATAVANGLRGSFENLCGAFNQFLSGL